MPRRFTLHTALLVLALAVRPTPAGAQDPAFWTHLKPGTTLPRCAESSIAFKDARARLFRFDDYLDTLAPSADPATAVVELHSMLRSECFSPAAETDRIPDPDSIPALKRWWDDGGFAWLDSYLELTRQNSRLYIATPPDARATLTPEISRNSSLRPLICPLDDVTCGVETLGWIRRAELAFEAHRIQNVEFTGLPVDPSPPPSTPDAVSEHCAETLPSGTNAARYGAWLDCIEQRRPITSALPVGRIKAPSFGWLIISGRRGHYEFCDTIRAYDLGTGAAFVHESCSVLALNPDGSVDRAATEKRRVDSVRSGTLSIDNLREVLWMLLLQPEAMPLQVRAEWYPLPDGLTPETVAFRERGPMWFGGRGPSTAQTTLSWRWIPLTGPAITGEATWPISPDAAEEHAATLLDIAELGLVPGCTPVGPPAESVLGRPPMLVNPVDAPPDETFRSKFAAAHKAWSGVMRCR